MLTNQCVPLTKQTTNSLSLEALKKANRLFARRAHLTRVVNGVGFVAEVFGQPALSWSSTGGTMSDCIWLEVSSVNPANTCPGIRA